jgi:hypothetical protein
MKKIAVEKFEGLSNIIYTLFVCGFIFFLDKLILSEPFLTTWWKIIICFFLFFPWKFGKDVYSVFGGVNSSGSVYSLFAFYQKSYEDAICIFGIPFYQRAGGDAFCLFGIPFYQGAGRDATCIFGIPFYQGAGEDAFCLFGIPFYQGAGRGATCIFGIPFYQGAGEDAFCLFGIPFYQRAGGDAICGFGIPFYQGAGRDAVCFLGIPFYQEAISCGLGIGISLFQFAKEKAFIGFGIAVNQKAPLRGYSFSKEKNCVFS